MLCLANSDALVDHLVAKSKHELKKLYEELSYPVYKPFKEESAAANGESTHLVLRIENGDVFVSNCSEQQLHTTVTPENTTSSNKKTTDCRDWCKKICQCTDSKRQKNFK